MVHRPPAEAQLAVQATAVQTVASLILEQADLATSSEIISGANLKRAQWVKDEARKIVVSPLL